VEDTLSTIPGNGYAYLLPDTTIAIISPVPYVGH
jgi:hypothetical protein